MRSNLVRRLLCGLLCLAALSVQAAAASDQYLVGNAGGYKDTGPTTDSAAVGGTAGDSLDPGATDGLPDGGGGGAADGAMGGSTDGIPDSGREAAAPGSGDTDPGASVPSVSKAVSALASGGTEWGDTFFVTKEYQLQELQAWIDGNPNMELTVYIGDGSVGGTFMTRFDAPLRIPAGKSVSVYDWGGNRFIAYPADPVVEPYPLFVIDAGGSLRMGGGGLTVYGPDGGVPGTDCPLFDVYGSFSLGGGDANLHIHGGRSDRGGTVYVHGGAELKILAAGNGNGGNVIFHGAYAHGGGGVFVDAGGTMRVEGPVGFDGCRADDGGGIYVRRDGRLSVSGNQWFNNCANLDGSGIGNNIFLEPGARLYEGYARKVYLAINPFVHGEDGFPGEPCEIKIPGHFFWFARHPDGHDGFNRRDNVALGADWNGNGWLAGDAVIDESIIDDPGYMKSVVLGDNTFGLFDTSGRLTRSYIRGVDWDALLRSLQSYAASWEDGFLVGPEESSIVDVDLSQYELIPYVVKYQTGTISDGWHIDCAVVPRERIQVDYVMNLPEGVELDPDEAGMPSLPMGVVGSDSVTFDVAPPSFGGRALAVGDWLPATVDGMPGKLAFLGWGYADVPDDAYVPGASATVDAATDGMSSPDGWVHVLTLRGVWAWTSDGLVLPDGPELPKTGGAGAGPILAAGAVLLIVAGGGLSVWLAYKKRRDSDTK